MSQAYITVSGGHNTSMTTNNAGESLRESLAVVLEYAYMGIGYGGYGSECHLAQNREKGCALCDSLTEVERIARAEAPIENWWRARPMERIRHRLRRPLHLLRQFRMVWS